MRLLKLLLPPDKISSTLADATRLSRAYARDLGGAPDDYRLLDLLPDPYPYFLFHDGESFAALSGDPEPCRRALDEFIRREYAPDYRDSLHRLVLRPPRNLGLRLRAFRLQHDLTLVETASLLGLSKSQLHRLERAERDPSPPTAFKILRLLTAPLPPSLGHGLSRAGKGMHLFQRESPAAPLRRQQAGWAGTSFSHTTGHGSRATCRDSLDSLRHLWLSGRFKTRDLAATLGISQPHLIRLLRGDRRPSKKLLERISSLLGTA